MLRPHNVALLLLTASAINSTEAAEVITRHVSLLGMATADQTIVFDPSESAYKAAYRKQFDLLKAGDASACANRGPWMQVVTDAQVGIEVKGIAALSGRQHVRQVSAAEEALFDLIKAGIAVPCG